MTGRYFKLETMGTVDGPGMRMVLFLQGCPLRCPYCHNPEGRRPEGGNEITDEEVIGKYRRYQSFYRNGGITVTGGEPLLQAAFVEKLFRRCKAERIHTALDTSGCIVSPEAERAINAADLLLLDVKSADQATCQERFGLSLKATKHWLTYCDTNDKQVWVRHVVAPGLTDQRSEWEMLAMLLSQHTCVKKVELLPFHKLCLEKYEALRMPFPMANMPEPTPECMEQARGVLARWQLPQGSFESDH